MHFFSLPCWFALLASTSAHRAHYLELLLSDVIVDLRQEVSRKVAAAIHACILLDELVLLHLALHLGGMQVGGQHDDGVCQNHDRILIPEGAHSLPAGAPLRNRPC